MFFIYSSLFEGEIIKDPEDWQKPYNYYYLFISNFSVNITPVIKYCV